MTRAVGSLWRAISVDPSYYLFWSLVILALAVACTGPIWYELRGIRRALEALPRR